MVYFDEKSTIFSPTWKEKAFNELIEIELKRGGRIKASKILKYISLSKLFIDQIYELYDVLKDEGIEIIDDLRDEELGFVTSLPEHYPPRAENSKSRADSIQYLKDVDKIPMMSDEEAWEELLQYITDEDQKHRKKVAEGFLRIPEVYARRTGEICYIDLVPEANLGLIYAIENFRLDKEIVFSTFVKYSVEHAIVKYLSERRHSPQRYSANSPMRETEVDFGHFIIWKCSVFNIENGKKPTPEQIAEETSCFLYDIREQLRKKPEVMKEYFDLSEEEE